MSTVNQHHGVRHNSQAVGTRSQGQHAGQSQQAGHSQHAGQSEHTGQSQHAGQPQHEKPHGAGQTHDTVTLSSQGGHTLPDEVDAKRQEQEVPAQEQELRDAPRDNTRPADGDDAEHYNSLLHEAAEFESGTHLTRHGTVSVSEENGVKTLNFHDGKGFRRVIVDENTGDVSEVITKPVFANGPNRLVQFATSYDRRGDVLGPVFQDSGSTVPFGTGASLGPSNIYSTAPKPKFSF